METPVVRSRGRPRKRRREELSSSGESSGFGPKAVDAKDFDGCNGNVREDPKSNGNPRKRGRPPKKRVVEVRGEAMVGRYVLKEFGGIGLFLGKIVSYDSGLYRVEYEDGDREDLDSDELREFVIPDEQQKFVGEMLERKGKLDVAITKKMGMQLRDEAEKGEKLVDEHNKNLKLQNELVTMEVDHPVELVCALEKVDLTKAIGRVCKDVAGNAVNVVGKIESSAPNEDPGFSDANDTRNGDSNYDYSSDDDEDSSTSVEYGQGWESRAETEIPAFPPPELPPSSGTVGVPEEYVSHLLSVYGFLRTFSIHLYLSPFTLDDLVGCLKCKVSNTLLDAIHVALLRTLKQHLESEASEGSLLASKCMKSVDWALLDTLTWPVYLFHYLMVMGHLDGQEWKGFYVKILDKDYCSLAIATKLSVLQILCDDALDTEEIKTEINTRVESEVGIDSDGVFPDVFEGETRKMYPRSSKTVNSGAENSAVCSSKTMEGSNHRRDRDDVGEDGNVDECRLCGMEGMLICCDGCPSAYHSRCIGVNKLSIPDGEWFCPECTISKISPPIALGTSFRGAEIFGMDPFGQLFVGTCNHLLVLKVSVKASSFVRYYNHHDVPKVISVLGSSPYHAVSYLGICQSISKYWELPRVVLSPLITNQASTVLENQQQNNLFPPQSLPSCENINQPGVVLENQQQNNLCPPQSLPSCENINQPGVVKVENETYAGNVGESPVGNASGLGSDNIFLQSSGNTSLGTPVQNDLRSMGFASTNQIATTMTSKPFEQAEPSRTIQQGLTDRSGSTGISLWPPGYESSVVSGHSNGFCLPEGFYTYIKEDNKAVVLTAQKKKDIFLYMGSIFKPFAYVNNYVHGAFAAFAAANFAGLSSDEARVTGANASDPRKAMAANVSLQVKAFSSAAVRFFWPSTEKKLVEIPRERCSWCFHCTASVVSRKGCLLNQAAVSATRAEMKFISSLRLVKTVDCGLYGIAAYTLFMEESLQGLLVGPFRSTSFREQWRKKVEQASTCSEMKYLLLDLERNFSPIALSIEWTKFVDNWMDDSSKSQSVVASASTQKRGPGKRKKHVATSEATADDSNDSKDFYWWRGGKLAKLVYQRATFPRGALRKVAIHGGARTLPGVYYTDSSDVPMRSRQFIWRAAVETAKNSSQLALQVRYLDQYIKWSDLVRPEQNPADGKGPETEALAFRNAHICGKKISENKIVYGVAFKHQKHLSTRLMKSVIEKEERNDGEVTYWFLEPRIPLYLIKEYEENAEKTDLPTAVKPDRYSKRQRWQLKASRREIFVYLARRRENLHTCPCASCSGDVLLEQSATCISCEGFCHKTCVLRSTELTNGDVEFRVTCRKCTQRKNLPLLNNSAKSPTSPLAMQGQEFQNSAAIAKSGKLKINGPQHPNSTVAGKSMSSKSSIRQPSVGTFDPHSEKKLASANSKSSKNKQRASVLNLGVVWKKKASDDGNDFRLKRVIFRGSADGLILTPQCFLCLNPYNPHLMYIQCEVCENWYHADAVKVDESRLPELVGFKCCRCRRIRSPSCPYGERKPEIKKLKIKGPKNERTETNSLSEAFSEPVESFPSTPMSMMEMDEDVFIEVDDPLIMSAPQIEQTPLEPKPEVDEWNMFGPGPQKLPVRRQVKEEKDDDGLTWNDVSSSQLPASVGNPSIEWDAGLDYGTGLNYESEFEPQTYFSLTDLLEVDGGSNPLEGVDAGSRSAWEDMPCENSQNGFMDQCNVTPFGSDMPKPSIQPAVNVLCEVCQEAAPAPNLACQICGLWFHRHCSPWDDENTVVVEDTWMCGQCREWS